MPELPEVETIRRQLAPRVAGRTIVEAEVFDPLWCAPRIPEEVEIDLRGERIESLGRRGKYLLLELEDQRFLLMHLRMTGNLLWVPRDEDIPGRPHLRVRLILHAWEAEGILRVGEQGTLSILRPDELSRLAH